jgi:surface polysaccharide O-acyltransferase-like enzyme
MQLQTQPATLRDPLSIVKGAYNFLFVPVPFVDNGSFFLNAQSYESFAWYIYYALLLVLISGFLRRKYQLNPSSIVAMYFTLGFILLSALVETNDGTSVRHRSVLLIGILIMLATFRPKNGKTIRSNFINTSDTP